MREPKKLSDFESPVDRMLRDEIRRKKQFDELRGPLAPLLTSDIVETARKNALAHQELFKSMTPEFVAGIREAAARNNALAEATKPLVTHDSVLAMQQTARAISKQMPDLQRQAEVWAKSLSPLLTATSQALSQNSATLAAAFRASEFAALSDLAQALRPNMAALLRTAEIFRNLDAVTLRASVNAEAQAKDLTDVIEHAESADDALTALAATHDPGEAVTQFAILIAALSALFARLSNNTAREIREMGLVGWALVALALLEAWPDTPSGEISPQAEPKIEEINREVAVIKDQLHELREVWAIADEKYVADLPRAVTRRVTNVRVLPSGSSRRMYRLEPMTPVAVAETQGRWRRIVLRDPLTSRLTHGWVYYSSLQSL